jgi:hypothetical protein
MRSLGLLVGGRQRSCSGATANRLITSIAAAASSGRPAGEPGLDDPLDEHVLHVEDVVPRPCLDCGCGLALGQEGAGRFVVAPAEVSA